MIDTERSDDNSFSLKHFGNMSLKTASKVPLLVEKDKKNDNFPIPEGMLDYILPKGSDSIDIGAKGQEKISSKTQSTDTSDNGLKSKLLFIRRASPDRIPRQLRQDESQRGFDDANQIPSKKGKKFVSLLKRCYLLKEFLSLMYFTKTDYQEISLSIHKQ